MYPSGPQWFSKAWGRSSHQAEVFPRLEPAAICSESLTPGTERGREWSPLSWTDRRAWSPICPACYRCTVGGSLHGHPWRPPLLRRCFACFLQEFSGTAFGDFQKVVLFRRSGRHPELGWGCRRSEHSASKPRTFSRAWPQLLVEIWREVTSNLAMRKTCTRPWVREFPKSDGFLRVLYRKTSLVGGLSTVKVCLVSYLLYQLVCEHHLEVSLRGADHWRGQMYLFRYAQVWDVFFFSLPRFLQASSSFTCHPVVRFIFDRNKNTFFFSLLFFEGKSGMPPYKTLHSN